MRIVFKTVAWEHELEDGEFVTLEGIVAVCPECGWESNPHETEPSARASYEHHLGEDERHREEGEVTGG